MSTIRVEATGQENLERARALLQNVEGGIDKAVRAAMSRSVQHVRSVSSKAIREQYAISAANIRMAENVKARYSYRNGVQAVVTFRGAKIPLYRYAGASPAAPTVHKDWWVKVPIKGKMAWVHPGIRAAGHKYKDTGPSPLAKYGNEAFVARMKSGHVGIFARTGGVTSEGRDEIKELMGSSVPQMLGHSRVEEIVGREFAETFDTQLNDAVLRILNGW